MTSASELFNRRHHRLGVGRYSLDPTFDSSPSPDLHLRLHDADSLRRHDHVRRLRHRSSHTERGADRFVHRRNRWSVVNDSDDSAENGRDMRVSGSDVLPVEVLLARERLLERLRGDNFSTNRQHGRDSTVGDQASEISNDVPTGGYLVSDLTSQMGRSQLLQELDQKPPGLTQEAIDCLHLEVFISRLTASVSRVLQDCSICLESFTDGDKLICLPCGHKFHSACLNPWVRSCGDCPYCRRGIVVNSHLPKKRLNGFYYIG
ncbi:hypothetical protein Lal_00046961 [Lupinus albus]|uniref:Putative transcription factor C2H2 family n=1 Tax=Lupinus albus TaxID=3870 RepID=A0A6A4QWC1_LUPAL|nr:putative transcription factor C2H2 family [Lupinus albus]KAF1878294.1 hypothetical protein Lal_00046961 [Lupinus albus]